MLAILLAQAVASPSPAATADSCNHEAAIVKAEYPRDFQPDSDGPLAATVAVVVEPDGSVKSASISKSSGDLSFNMASIRATPSWAPGGTPSPQPR